MFYWSSLFLVLSLVTGWVALGIESPYGAVADALFLACVGLFLLTTIKAATRILDREG